MGDRESSSEWDVGGLRVTVTFREPSGATLRLYGPMDRRWEELLRFDDFVDGPHYHAPASGDPIPLDHHILGDPLDWFLAAVADHLEVLLVTAGYQSLLPHVNLGAVAAGVARIRTAMTDCVPDGYGRVAGKGLQRLAS